LLAIVIVCVAGAGCIPYSSYQDARIVEKGVNQGTVAVSASTYRDEWTEAGHWYPIELGPRMHLSARADAAFKFSFLMVPGSDQFAVWPIIGGDIRVAVVPDYLLLAVPVYFFPGPRIFSNMQLQPGVVMTVPLSHAVDLNSAARVNVFANPDAWDWDEGGQSYSFNLGLGLHLSRGLIVRPEVGWLVVPGTGRRYTEFGVGFTTYSRPTEVAGNPSLAR
jgi:hypothetical protein